MRIIVGKSFPKSIFLYDNLENQQVGPTQVFLVTVFYDIDYKNYKEIKNAENLFNILSNVNSDQVLINKLYITANQTHEIQLLKKKKEQVFGCFLLVKRHDGNVFCTEIKGKNENSFIIQSNGIRNFY